MCGIAGSWAWHGAAPAEEMRLGRMLDAMAHRGPDDRVVAAEHHGLCWGAIRLAVVDPGGSAQPLRDGDLALLFNGEIYNHRGLRARLRHHRLRTAGDGEVILALYREDPAEFTARLDGMFAFALWDGIRRRLVLGRDPNGIKPLLYWADGRQVVFASEAKGLLAHPAVPLGVDHEAVSSYLRARFPFPPHSAFAGVRKLPSGAVLVADAGGCRIRTVRRSDRPDHGDSRADEVFAGVLAEATDTSLHDVDSAAMLLSGGIDSGMLTALAARHRPGRRIETFSVGYGHGGHEDERPQAAEISGHLGLTHRTTVLAGPDVLHAFLRVAWHLEEPIYTPVTLSTFAVAELAAHYDKVAVSGDGSDELLLGYDHFHRCRRIAEQGGPWEEVYWRALGWLAQDERARLAPDLTPPPGREPRLRDLVPGERPMDLMRGFEIAYKLQEYHLTRVDRLSMAHGLEVRVPYLRDQVVSWALSRPADKLVAGEAKQPLREAAAGYLPPASLSRPKKKYSAPARLWLRGPLRGLTQELLHTGDGVTELGLNPRAVAALARRFDRDPGADTATVWGVLVLLAWYSLVYTRLRDMRAGRS